MSPNKRNNINIILEEHGALSVDFLFAIALSFSLTVMIFVITLTLSIVESVQYISFAVARNYFAAHFTPADQEALARAKFAALLETPALKPFFIQGLYVMKPSDLEVGLNADNKFQQDYGIDPNSDREVFVGARVLLNLKFMEMKIPFLGPTYEDENKFLTHVSSFAGREPTQQECNEFNINRAGAIAGAVGHPLPDYAVMGDNGC